MGVPIRVSAEYDILVKDRQSTIQKQKFSLKLHHVVRFLVFGITGTNTSKITKYLMANLLMIDGKNCMIMIRLIL